MEATINVHYPHVGKAISDAVTPPNQETPKGLMVARRSLVDELPGAVIGIATIVYIVTSLIALA
jgi:hypothetical protein